MITPYAAHKYVNDRLREAGLEKRIPGPMMYNYTYGRIDQGKTPFIKSDRKTGVDPDDLKKWTESYVQRKVLEVQVKESTETV